MSKARYRINLRRRGAILLLLIILHPACTTESTESHAMTPRRLAELEEARQVSDDRDGRPSEHEYTIPAGEGLYVESTTPAPSFKTPEQARFYYHGTYPDLARRYYRSLRASGQAAPLPQHERLKLIAYTEDGILVCVEQAESGIRSWTSMKQLLNNTEEPTSATTADAVAGAAAFGASLAIIPSSSESSASSVPTSPAPAAADTEAQPTEPAKPAETGDWVSPAPEMNGSALPALDKPGAASISAP